MEQLEAAKAAWGMSGDLVFVRRVENFVYEGRREDRPVILRLTHPDHRARHEIEAELDWMDHLAQGGLRLARPVPSRRGLYAETLEGVKDGPIFFAAVFEKIPGRTLSGADEFTDPMLRTWGRYLGRMHALTRTYVPGPHLIPRRDWDRDDGLLVARRGLDPADGAPHDRFLELLEWLGTLPREPGAFGLVHGDLHHGNFFVEEGEITAFDFDDSCHHWNAYDLMVPFFTNLGVLEDEGRPDDLPAMLAPFLEGYRSAYPLDPEWEARLPAFLDFRTALLYHWIKVRIGEGLFSGKALEWCRRRMALCEVRLRDRTLRPTVVC